MVAVKFVLEVKRVLGQISFPNFTKNDFSFEHSTVRLIFEVKCVFIKPDQL